MILVPLTMGYFAIVDDEDIEVLAKYNWQAYVDKKSPTKTVYAYRRAPRPKRGRIWMHRVLLSAPDGVKVDHRDGNGLNNRRSNIRTASDSQNLCNGAIRSDNTSGFKGVHFLAGARKKQWEARIHVGGKPVCLGTFETLEQAGLAYDVAAVKHFGEFARLNFPAKAA